jgi:HAD superfamily hydrolase (TIGR01509 family)
MRPAAVLWDMDGTLLDSEKLWDIPLFEAARRVGGSLSAAARAAMVGTNVPTTLDLLFADVGVVPDPALRADIAAFIDKRMTEIFADPLPFQPGAREALAMVHGTGVPAALVTSTERALTELALDTIGRGYFEIVVCGDEVDGLTKPHPEPYLRAARLLGVSPADCLAIEDSPNGVSSAVAAGCAVIAVPSEVPIPPSPHHTLRDSLLGLAPHDLTAPFGRS